MKNSHKKNKHNFYFKHKNLFASIILVCSYLVLLVIIFFMNDNTLIIYSTYNKRDLLDFISALSPIVAIGISVASGMNAYKLSDYNFQKQKEHSEKMYAKQLEVIQKKSNRKASSLIRVLLYGEMIPYMNRLNELAKQTSKMNLEDSDSLAYEKLKSWDLNTKYLDQLLNEFDKFSENEQKYLEGYLRDKYFLVNELSDLKVMEDKNNDEFKYKVYRLRITSYVLTYWIMKFIRSEFDDNEESLKVFENKYKRIHDFGYGRTE